MSNMEMVSNNNIAYGEPSKELLEAHTHIWKQMMSLTNSFSLKCAIQLGIPDIIHNHNKPMTISELVSALHIDPAKADCLRRLMRNLVHSGFFTKTKLSNDDDDDGEEGYSLTLASRLLLKDEPTGARPMVICLLDSFMTRPWQELDRWFQTDGHPTLFSMVHGRTIWDYMEHQPEPDRLFNEAMASDARFVASVVIRDYPQVFEGVESMVDVGGGTGHFAKAISEAFPHVKCTVLDLPHVVNGLKGTQNLSYVGGDMFQYIPPTNVAFLKWILHDWDDESCVRLLKNCKRAIPSKEKGGKVIIIDMVVNNPEASPAEVETQLSVDMLVMTLYPGKERTEKEWAKLFLDAGFTNYNIANVVGMRSIIELYP